MAGEKRGQRQTSSSKEEVQLQVDVGVIKAAQVETNRRLGNIEDVLKNLSTVSQEDFKVFVKYVEDTFVKKESLKGAKAVGLAVLTALAVSATLGIAKLLGTKF